MRGFPPPLNIFNVLRYCCPCIGGGSGNTDLTEITKREWRQEAMHRYWKSIAEEYWVGQKMHIQTSNGETSCCKLLESRIQRVQEMMNNLHKINRNLYTELEDLKQGMDIKKSVHGSSQQDQYVNIHTLARLSPYPGTQIERFLVHNKFVPWGQLLNHYDPAVYTMPASSFPDSQQHLVDNNLLKKMGLHNSIGAPPTRSSLSNAYDDEKGNVDDSFQTENEDPSSGKLHKARISAFMQRTVNKNENQERWIKEARTKRSTEYKWHTEGSFQKGDIVISLDRRTWTSSDEYFSGVSPMLGYDIDITGLPVNPRGRTGLRGRGCLPRWGPNHSVSLLLTRWRRDTKGKIIFIEGHKQLEFLTVLKNKQWSLPGGITLGEMTVFSYIIHYFNNDVLHVKDKEVLPKTERETLEFFNKFVVQTGSSGCVGRQVFKNYLDDSRNTDNAWLELQAWSFHFGEEEQIEEKSKLTDRIKWREVTKGFKLLSTSLANILQDTCRMLMTNEFRYEEDVRDGERQSFRRWS